MTPALHHRLPHRRAGSFGHTAVPSRVAEWITTTWFRFNSTLCWLVIVLAILLQPQHESAYLLLPMLVVSPIAAVMFCGMLQVMFWLAMLVPGVGMVPGLIRLIYATAFSRLIVEPAPDIEMPLWTPRR
jgi:hypothetical protein